jgi:hypothetical protein
MAGKEEIPKELSPFIKDCYKEGEKVNQISLPYRCSLVD